MNRSPLPRGPLAFPGTKDSVLSSSPSKEIREDGADNDNEDDNLHYEHGPARTGESSIRARAVFFDGPWGFLSLIRSLGSSKIQRVGGSRRAIHGLSHGQTGLLTNRGIPPKGKGNPSDFMHTNESRNGISVELRRARCECGGQDLNLGTPSGRDPKSRAVSELGYRRACGKTRSD